MGKIKENWVKSTLSSKIFMLVLFILFCIITVIYVIGIFGIININTSGDIMHTIIMVMTLLCGIRIYKNNKASAIFIFCCFAILLFFRVSSFYMKYFK